MTDKENKDKKLSLSSSKLGLKKKLDVEKVALSSTRRGKVAFEVKKSRKKAPAESISTLKTKEVDVLQRRAAQKEAESTRKAPNQTSTDSSLTLTNTEKSARELALKSAQLKLEEERVEKERLAEEKRVEQERIAAEEAAALEEQKQQEASQKVDKTVEAIDDDKNVEASAQKEISSTVEPKTTATEQKKSEPEERKPQTTAKVEAKAAPAAPKTPKTRREEPRRRAGKLTVAQALVQEDEQEKQRSLASIKRAREKERNKILKQTQEAVKITRDVIVPDLITVQELANRMTEKSGDVIKSLMKMGVMATVNQTIDADTAELIVSEFGHNMKRVSEADVEEGIEGPEDRDEDLVSRPPVVTVMGHVDHGKTSLLDRLRKANVAAGEAGGITQHLGAYQVNVNGQPITFIDTPGHEAFTAMRSRGANVTDIIILVVAADDGVQPQTKEAISHAKAAGVPIIVAINKIDKPDVDPQKVKTELLSYEVQVEDMGGEVLACEISAKTGENIEQLLESIVLQSELLDLKANADREAVGIVIESRLDKGRGSVATILVQKGTLSHGDVFVVGSQWGKVRALINDKGSQVKTAGPSVPVEVLGLNGTPIAGDRFVVVESEAKAREISEFRNRKSLEEKNIQLRGSLEQMFSKISSGESKELAVLIKADVQGSAEAIANSLSKLSNDEVKVNILHSGVGIVNETDVSLAVASKAYIIGFNVRATSQARNLADSEKIDIRYYSIIYDIIDDVKSVLSGLLKPAIEEKYIGTAEIREIFSVSKIGKIAGCRVTSGSVKKGQKVRILRDGVVAFEGMLKSLRHVKKEVEEIKEGYECGMSFENFQDIHPGDTVECFEIIEVKRTLD